MAYPRLLGLILGSTLLTFCELADLLLTLAFAAVSLSVCLSVYVCVPAGSVSDVRLCPTWCLRSPPVFLSVCVMILML